MHPTLPSNWYYEESHYRRELKSIWWDEWVCVGRLSELAETGQFQLVQIGDQQVFITRDPQGRLRAFHNTCRHRGSVLCETESGTFGQGRITCPYHAWVYSLEGKLLRTPRMGEAEGFQAENFSLYPVAVDSWAGFVFINLAVKPERELQARLADEEDSLGNWPLQKLALAHRQVHELKCNWKVFWENFLECYHCPNIHHDLCELVPLYRQGTASMTDLPADHPLRLDVTGSLLKPGAVTWSGDGSTNLPWFESLSPEEQVVGMTFFNLWPSIFVVAHVDYVRSVRVLPQGPERTRLTVDWLVSPDTLNSEELNIQDLIAFGNQVVREDARVCELNQKGLHCQQHERGVLTPTEYDVLAFDQWVLARLGED